MLCSSGRDIIILESRGYRLADITTKHKRNIIDESSFSINTNIFEQNEMTENECK